jgi:hypothetical protein
VQAKGGLSLLSRPAAPAFASSSISLSIHHCVCAIAMQAHTRLLLSLSWQLQGGNESSIPALSFHSSMLANCIQQNHFVSHSSRLSDDDLGFSFQQTTRQSCMGSSSVWPRGHCYVLVIDSSFVSNRLTNNAIRSCCIVAMTMQRPTNSTSSIILPTRACRREPTCRGKNREKKFYSSLELPPPSYLWSPGVTFRYQLAALTTTDYRYSTYVYTVRKKKYICIHSMYGYTYIRRRPLCVVYRATWPLFCHHICT